MICGILITYFLTNQGSPPLQLRRAISSYLVMANGEADWEYPLDQDRKDKEENGCNN